ncbi:MAG: imelysin family protein [Bacteroidota bacterium]
MKVLVYTMLSVLLVVGFSACGEDDNDGGSVDNFDREAMLTSWVDNFILPAYSEFTTASTALTAAATTFETTPDQASFDAVRAAFVDTYRKWQKISLYQIGQAEALGLREQVNAFPTDVAGIEANISDSNFNLALPSQRDRQGFPALDYLLYGTAADAAAILDRFVNEPAMRAYLVDVASRIEVLTKDVEQAWLGTYRGEFISNSGSGATASVDRFVNDFIFYYEKWLRAGKVGIPAGVFSSQPQPGRVEARYNGELARTLTLDALATAQDFFNGNGANGPTAFGFADYLASLNTTRDGADLGQLINDQLNVARTAIQGLDQDFEAQVTNDNISMLGAYDELQKVVVLIKVDMVQAFNVAIDFVDADGD